MLELVQDHGSFGDNDDHSGNYVSSAENIQRALVQLDVLRTKSICALLTKCVNCSAEYTREGPESGSRSALDNVLTCSKALSRMLSEQLVSSQETGLYNVCRVAWDHSHVGSMLQQALKEMDRESLLQAFRDHMVRVEKCIQENDYEGMARSVESLETLSSVDESMHASLEAVRGRVSDLVLRGILNSIQFQSYMPDVASGEAHMDVLWRCSKTMGIVRQGIQKVSDLVFDKSIHPVMSKFVDTSKYPVGYREKILFKILKYVADVVLCGTSDLVSLMGEELWGRVAGLCIELITASNDQTSDENGQGIRQANFSKKLEAKVAGLGYLPSDVKGPIAIATAEYVRGVLRDRRAEILEKVRDALIVPLQKQEVVVFGKNEPLLKVSPGDGKVNENDDVSMFQESPSSLMRQDIYDELRSHNDMCLGASETPIAVLESFKFTSELILESISHQDELSDAQQAHFMHELVEDVSSLILALMGLNIQKSEPLVYPAALLYMSLIYMARCFSIFTLFAGKVHRESSKISTAAETMRQLAETMLKCMLVSQQAELDGDIDMICQWRQDVDVQDIIRKKKSIQKLRHIFQRLGSSLSGADIPDDMFERIVSYLAGYVLDKILQSIMELADISEDLSESIPQVLDDLLDRSGSSCQSEGILYSAVSGRLKRSPQSDATAEIQTLARMTPSVKKLVDLCEIMSLSSREIVHKWIEGSFGFSREETLGLISSLFEDTPQVQESKSMI